MSEENVELVRTFYEAARESAWDAGMINRGLISPEVEFDLSALYPDAPIIRGFDQVARWAESGPWGRSARFEAEGVLDVDDERVLVLVRVTARGQESGVPVEIQDAHEVTVRDGVVVRVKVYADRAEALEAAGLREWAMSKENVDALRPVYEEWGRGNFRPSSDAYGPDLEWGWSEEFPDIHGVFRDSEPRSSRMLEWLSQWEDWRVEAEEYIPAGEFVVVLCRYTGRGKESGVAVDTTGAHLWTMRAGKPVRLEVFSSRTKALEAAGLRE